MQSIGRLTGLNAGVMVLAEDEVFKRETLVPSSLHLSDY